MRLVILTALLAASASAAPPEEGGINDFDGPFALTVEIDGVVQEPGAIKTDGWRDRDTAAVAFLSQSISKQWLAMYYLHLGSGRLVWNGGIQRGLGATLIEADTRPENNDQLLWAGLTMARKGEQDIETVPGLAFVSFTRKSHTRTQMVRIKNVFTNATTDKRFGIKKLESTNRGYLTFKGDYNRFVLCEKSDRNKHDLKWDEGSIGTELNIIIDETPEVFKFPANWESKCKRVNIVVDRGTAKDV